MKNLKIKMITGLPTELDYFSLAATMVDLDWNHLQESSWREQYPYTPLVQFQIGYTTTHIILHFHVQEEFIKAQYIRPNENVWEDSCVEFFISFDDRNTYYNLEFNSLGTGLIGYGPSIKKDRNRLSADEIQQVETFTSIQSTQEGKKWQEILLIPISIFQLANDSLKNRVAHANFYKCGDALPNPHFISWNKIKHATPNFHLPEFFGEIEFV